MANQSDYPERAISPLEARWRASRQPVEATPAPTLADALGAKVAQLKPVVVAVPAVAPAAPAVEVAPVIEAASAAVSETTLAPELAAETAPALGFAAPVALAPAGRVTFAGSSNVKAATLDEKTGVVDVEFTNGAVHKFGGMTPDLMSKWSAHESAGKWFHTNIRLQPAKHPMLSEPSSPPPGVKSK